MARTPRASLADLERADGASLEALQRDHPSIWKDVGDRLVAAAGELAQGRPQPMEQLVSSLVHDAAEAREQVRRSHADPAVLARALPRVVAARMAKLASERFLLAAATGKAHGSVRLGTWSGSLVQGLFFEEGLRRRPVPMTTFRLVWPLVTQKRFVMPLVQLKGIYCFYSRELVEALVGLLAGRSALEIAAGDGTLTRFLVAAGADIRATDDHSWSHAVTFPAEVERLDAVAALQKHRPRAVVCSFPPPGNAFERRVFASVGVDLYVVITTRHRFAAGDWQAYEDAAFERVEDTALSRLVLPPILDPAVLVFRRRTA